MRSFFYGYSGCAYG